MNGPAVIRVNGVRDSFSAESVVIEGGLVHAGCWATRWGPSNRFIRYGQPCARSWPTHAVAEIRWAESQVAA